jgi:hypothetical protein
MNGALLAQRGVLTILCAVLLLATWWGPVLLNDLAWLLLAVSAGAGLWRGLTRRRGDKRWWVGVSINATALAVLIAMVALSLSGPND